MAAIIGALKLYGDVRYTVGGREVPPPGSTKLPAAKYTFSNVKCAETVFTLDLPVKYFDALGLTYLSAQIAVDNQPQTVYGWITGINQISGVRDGVRIVWEIDYWRSYAHLTVLRYGRITRCPQSHAYLYAAGRGTDVCRPVYQRITDVDKKSDHTLATDPSRMYLEHNWALFCHVTSGQDSAFSWGCFPIES